MLFFRQSLGNVIALAIGLLSSVLLARLLGAEGRGEYALAVKAAGLIVAIGQWGIAEVLLQVVPERRGAMGSVVGTTLLLAVGGGVVIALLALAAVPVAQGTILRDVRGPVVGLALAGGVASLVGVLARRFVQLQGSFDLYNGLDIMRVLVFVSLAAALMIFGPSAAFGAVLAWALAELALALAASLAVWRRVARDWHFDLSLAGTLIVAGLPLQAGLLATYVGNEAGVFVLNATLDLAAVGAYVVSMTLARLVLQVSLVMRTVLQPRLMGATADAAAITVQVTRHGILWMVLGALVLLAAAPLVPLVFGPDFAAAIPPLGALLPGMIAYGVMQLVVGYLLRMGKRRVVALSSLVLATASVGLQWFGAQEAGLVGAAIGSSVAYGLAAALIVLAFARTAHQPPWVLLPRRAELGQYAVVARQLLALRRGQRAPRTAA